MKISAYVSAKMAAGNAGENNGEMATISGGIMAKMAMKNNGKWLAEGREQKRMAGDEKMAVMGAGKSYGRRISGKIIMAAAMALSAWRRGVCGIKIAANKRNAENHGRMAKMAYQYRISASKCQHHGHMEGSMAAKYQL